MTEFINMWKNYVNFGDRTTRRGYWMAALFNFIIAVVISVLAQFVPALGIVSLLYGLAVLLPGLAIAVRRLRDAGKKWTNIFWVFLPFIGVIIYIILLCKPSVESDGVSVV